MLKEQLAAGRFYCNLEICMRNATVIFLSMSLDSKAQFSFDQNGIEKIKLSKSSRHDTRKFGLAIKYKKIMQGLVIIILSKYALSLRHRDRYLFFFCVFFTRIISLWNTGRKNMFRFLFSHLKRRNKCLTG